MFKNLSSNIKHLIHCFVLISIVAYFEFNLIYTSDEKFESKFDPFQVYGYAWTCLLYICRILIFLTLPQASFNFLGLTLYNAFLNKVSFKSSPISSPLICFRVVTKGDFPDLVKKNLERNIKTCFDVGLEHFTFEVVTDIPLNIDFNYKLRQLIVPKEYKTKTGALFKARALQYCLEDNINKLRDSDWIVHLDEETIITENSARGIINFVVNDQYDFGQGIITYANEEILNWLTTLADSYRVADDYGKLRFQFSMLHYPIFSWKGSYVVTKYKAEKDVSFDHGLEGSIAEDCYFSMIAFKKNYKFNFIEGEMWEKSPITILDFIRQRKRWLKGILLVVHSKKVPLKNKLFLSLSFYAWLTLPLSTSNLIWAYFFPLPKNRYIFLNAVVAFVAALNTYMYIFGIIKSFKIKKIGFIKFILCIIGTILAIPFNIIIENLAVCLGIFDKKKEFYIVKKI